MLTGKIPSELGRLPFLGNPQNGTYSSIYRRDNYPLAMALNANQLMGTIPSELGNMKHNQLLHLQDNMLTGAIPSELGQLTGNKFLLLENNNLTGTIAPDLIAGMSDSLQSLQLHGNQLSGHLPSELGLCSKLSTLTVANNTLTGSIPVQFGSLAAGNESALGWVDLSGTFLTGSVPSDLCTLDDPDSALLLFDCSSTLCGCSCNCSADTDNGTSIVTFN